MKTNIIFRQLFDEKTWTYSYIIGDSISRNAVIIDPVLDKVDRDLGLLEELELSLVYILDTHIHADHITGSGILRQKTSAKIAMGNGASIAKPDILLNDNETLSIGDIIIQSLETPGHTNGCTSYLVDDMIFTGDTLLIRKTGRTDFQQGSAEKLYNSIKNKIYTLPDSTIIYPGHDYTGQMMSTVWEEKRYNTRIKENTSLEELKETLDAMKLDYPKYIDVALPANMKLGLDDGKM
ncbi:MBL fold metallo-hydrolase [Candidatus Gracilibacteria bacterium]|nr:MBL fold metallo-hydrolase [Candidatus Gracilibacteria bacterium]